MDNHMDSPGGGATVFRTSLQYSKMLTISPVLGRLLLAAFALMQFPKGMRLLLAASALLHTCKCASWQQQATFPT